MTDKLPTKFTTPERQFIHCLVRGMPPTSAAKSVGLPYEQAMEFYARDDVREHIESLRAVVTEDFYRPMGEIQFTRNDATFMYLDAHRKAKDATEEIKATDSLVKLHGIAAPEKKEVSVTATTSAKLRQLDDNALIEMAGEDLLLDPSEYTVMDDKKDL